MEAAALTSHINGIVKENVVIVNKCEDKPNKNGYHQNGYLNGICKNEIKNSGNESTTNGLINGHSKDLLNGNSITHIPRPLRPNQRLRIAQIAPLYESVPPKMYGGTERVVHYLTEELVRRGHKVTLFCSSDSKSSAEMITNNFWTALRLNPVCMTIIPFLCMLEDVRKRQDEFDILHFHTIEHFGMLKDIFNRSVTTLHGKLCVPDLVPLFNCFNYAKLISISDNQRTHLKFEKPNFIGTVHHGIPKNLFNFTEKPKGDNPYLAFLGRIAEEKRPDLAIKIAVKANIPLKIAAKIDKVDIEYWENEVKPLIEQNNELVEYIGEISDNEKGEFLGNARALLFSIDWPEPFGLVLAESMACGTPIVARPCGSVPEVVEDGVTGIIFDTIDEGVEAVKRVHKMDRTLVRNTFEKRFTSEIMAENYLKVN
ncbi:Glycos_transf_1 domain-containing protein [Meloidogyne graminicola]|uniref:Glycos_transf_1 domain-containing protein n=1 Tax=Meloidogyne graminicola TaxID=189291 RepID=A0A8S9ZVL9_9BILA|nr:Glycos_transf_1 domain-containing protein [Meloidogyne graminicola]